MPVIKKYEKALDLYVVIANNECYIEKSVM